MRVAVITLALAVLTGCATTQGTGSDYVPMIDMQGVDDQKAQADLEDCQRYSTQAMNAAQGAAVGAIAAALLGAFLAPRGYRNDVAGHAAVLGALGGAGQAEGGQRAIISRCMSGRGYRVLN